MWLDCVWLLPLDFIVASQAVVTTTLHYIHAICVSTWKLKAALLMTIYFPRFYRFSVATLFSQKCIQAISKYPPNVFIAGTTLSRWFLQYFIVCLLEYVFFFSSYGTFMVGMASVLYEEIVQYAACRLSWRILYVRCLCRRLSNVSVVAQNVYPVVPPTPYLTTHSIWKMYFISFYPLYLFSTWWHALLSILLEK